MDRGQLRRCGWKCAACLVVVLSSVAVAANGDQPAAPVLRLRSGKVRLERTTAADRKAIVATKSPTRHIVQLANPLTRAQHAAIKRAGVKLQTYLPDNAYVADLRDADCKLLANMDFVRHVGPYRTIWKLDPRLAKLGGGPVKRDAQELQQIAGAREGYRRLLDPDRTALFTDRKVRVLISTFGDTPIEQAFADLRTVPGVVVLDGATVGDGAVINAVVSLHALADVAAVSSVQFIEDAPHGVLRNDLTVSVVQSGTNWNVPVWDHTLHGTDQIVGLIDAPPYLGHCMFTDVVSPGPTHRKFVAFRNVGGSSSHSHGTHVAGTLAGDLGTYDVSDPFDGVAYGARISFSNYFDVNSAPESLISRLIDAHNDGARVHSNSWGDDSTTAYTTWCKLADQFSYDHEDDLVCFSSTNNTFLATPENAKNILSVGGSDQYPNHNFHYIGGMGPTADGRRKPEIFTPARSISSASVSSCSISSGTGTSYACPSVAASAALVRQYFVEGFYPDGLANAANALVPSGALMKGVLLNAAMDMTGESGYPSNVEGWGRLVLDRGLYFYGETRRLIVRDVRNAAGMQTGAADSFQFTVLDAGEDVRVTMVFTDPPATVGTWAPMINNLDLVVTGPSTGGDPGSTYLGNHFVGGQSATGGTADSINNVEQIHFSTPSPGIYTVEVNATYVNALHNTQGYALAIAGNVVEGAYAPPPNFADPDLDGDKDLIDFAGFQSCFTGDGVVIGAPACALFDADGDEDVDLTDYALFHIQFTGPDVP